MDRNHTRADHSGRRLDGQERRDLLMMLAAVKGEGVWMCRRGYGGYLD